MSEIPRLRCVAPINTVIDTAINDDNVECEKGNNGFEGIFEKNMEKLRRGARSQKITNVHNGLRIENTRGKI